MGRDSRYSAIRIGVSTLTLAVVLPAIVRADGFEGNGNRDHRRAVYQRHAFGWMDKQGHSRFRKHGTAHHWAAPQVSSGWFQRPYPYHLDYYKMRYGGSYAPYFGNLYGPPQVVTAPPYYGPYYGGYDYGSPNGFRTNGVFPGGPQGVTYGSPEENLPPNEQPAVPANGKELPPSMP